MTATLHIHTDGSCLGNPGSGGFAAIMEIGDERITVTGGNPDTTNNHMEIMAVIQALTIAEQELTTDVPIVVHTDSKYVTEPFNQGWLNTWKQRGWRNSKGHLPNASQWKKLDQLTQGKNITWTWVKGHSGDPMNEACDRLAVEQAELARSINQSWTSVGTPRSRAHGHDNVLANIVEPNGHDPVAVIIADEPQQELPGTDQPRPSTLSPEETAHAALSMLKDLAAAIEQADNFDQFKGQARQIFQNAPW